MTNVGGRCPGRGLGEGGGHARHRRAGGPSPYGAPLRRTLRWPTAIRWGNPWCGRLRGVSCGLRSVTRSPPVEDVARATWEKWGCGCPAGERGPRQLKPSATRPGGRPRPSGAAQAPPPRTKYMSVGWWGRPDRGSPTASVAVRRTKKSTRSPGNRTRHLPPQPARNTGENGPDRARARRDAQTSTAAGRLIPGAAHP